MRPASRQGRATDYVVVGGGAAGAALAARLSEDPSVSVLLVEAGGRARGPLFSVPLMSGLLLRSGFANWNYVTEPEAELAGRRIKWPRGKALGGSTVINGMVWRRGAALDFDLWAQAGLGGWSWTDVEPYFRRAERRGPEVGASHGTEGAVPLSRGRLKNPLFDAWLEAGRTLGLPMEADFNNGHGHGVGRYDFSIHRGQRVTSARAYLAEAERRVNLDVLTHARTLRVIVEGGRARGIEVERGGERLAIDAEREVILSAGAIGSPHLLMLSGVGPADVLRRHGIAVAADVPGVGQALQDHVLVRVEHKAAEPVTLDNLRRIDRAAFAFLRAVAFGTGPAASFPIEFGGLLKSEPGLEDADLQLSILPALSSATMRLPGFGRVLAPDRGAGFFASVFQMRPSSRGEITIANADPFAPPVIRPRYLTAPGDRDVLRRGVRLLRDIFRQPAFDRYRGDELAPGAALQSDAELDGWISATADTVYHTTSTCRMGADHDGLAVVDRTLRVRGVSGLRIADASVMPSVPSGNTAAPTMMIAEKAADFIRAERERAKETA